MMNEDCCFAVCKNQSQAAAAMRNFFLSGHVNTNPSIGMRIET